MKIYIAGPMRGYAAYNFPAFFQAERALLGMQHSTFNPARNDVNHYMLGNLMEEDPTGYLAGEWLLDHPQDFNLREALNADLAWITSEADALVVLEGWEASKGAQAEVATARAIGIPVYTLWQREDFSYHLETVALKPDSMLAEKCVSDDHVAEPEHEPSEEMWRPLFDRYPEYANNERADDYATSAEHELARLLRGEEVRTTSATGGQKGTKLAAFDQISPEVEWLVAEHFGKGAAKYSAHNFRKGYPWSKSYSALRRHLAAFWSGEEYDNHKPDCPADCVDHTGSLHIVAVIWHAMVLTEFYLHRKQYDDRYVYTEGGLQDGDPESEAAR